MSTVQDVPRLAAAALAAADRTQEIPLLPAGDIAAGLDPAEEQLAGLTQELTQLLTTEDAPAPTVDGVVWPPTGPAADPLTDPELAVPASTPPVPVPDPRSDVEIAHIEDAYRVLGELTSLCQLAATVAGLPTAPLTGHALAPRMLVEVTDGTEEQRRAEVDRVAALLGVAAELDYYTDLDRFALYCVQVGPYRIETVIGWPPAPPALAPGTDLVPCGIEVITAELVDDDQVPMRGPGQLSVPGVVSPAWLAGRAVPTAGVSAPLHQLVGADR